VQAHIASLEEFRRETTESNRKAFVQSLVDSNRLPVTMQKSTEEFALGLSPDQWSQYVATQSAAPAHPLLGQYGTTQQPGEARTERQALENELEVQRGIVRQHKLANMSQDKLEATQSFQRVKSLESQLAALTS